MPDRAIAELRRAATELGACGALRYDKVEAPIEAALSRTLAFALGLVVSGTAWSRLRG